MKRRGAKKEKDELSLGERQIAQFFNLVEAAVRYQDWEDRLSVERFRWLRGLGILDRWTEKTDDEKAAQLKVERDAILRLRSSPEYQEIKHALLEAAERVKKIRNVADYVKDTEIQNIGFQRLLELMQSEDGKVAERATATYMDRAMPSARPEKERTILVISRDDLRAIKETEQHLLDAGDVIEGELVG